MKDDEPKSNYLLVLAGMVVFVVLIMLTNWYFLRTDLEHRGTFGDMFGVVNALFSGLAFGGVIYAILLQRNELELQGKELRATRIELRGQREQQIVQNQTLRKQNF